MLPWGVAAARRLGVVDDLLAAGGHQVPFFNVYFMGTQTEHRPFPMTTPTGKRRSTCTTRICRRRFWFGPRTRAWRSCAEPTLSRSSEQEGGWRVTFGENGTTRSITARLVVGADGRFSGMREMGGFTVRRDPDHLRIAGTLVEGTKVPDDGVHFCLGPGFGTFIAPLGNGRARVYFVYVGALGDRKLSGKRQSRGVPRWMPRNERAGGLVRRGEGGRPAGRIRGCRPLGAVTKQAGPCADRRCRGRHRSQLGLRPLQDAGRRRNPRDPVGRD